MHQEKVEILDAAGLQLALEEREDIFLLFEEGRGQFVRQNIALTRVAARQALAQRQLALALDVAVGGVEIVEAAREKEIDHLFELLDVHVLADHRQAHAAEAEAMPDLREKGVLAHGYTLLFDFVAFIMRHGRGKSKSFRAGAALKFPLHKAPAYDIVIFKLFLKGS